LPSLISFHFVLRSLPSPLSALSLFTFILSKFPSVTTVEITKPRFEFFQLCILLIIFHEICSNLIQWRQTQLHLIYFLQPLKKHGYLMNMEGRNTR
jgi:hypothetical protein